jgi:hypothetical protein
MNQSQFNPFPAALRQSIGSFSPCLTLVLALSATACGSSEPPSPGAAGAAGASAAPSETETVGRMLDGPQTCTREKTICAKLQIPNDMVGVPDSVHFTIYDSNLPPTHPPNGYAGVFPSAQLTAGEMKHFELTDGGLQGDYWLWGVIYMPGGGLFGLPVIGVDFVQANEPLPLHLDGSPLNLSDPILVHLVPPQSAP